MQAVPTHRTEHWELGSHLHGPSPPVSVARMAQGAAGEFGAAAGHCPLGEERCMTTGYLGCGAFQAGHRGRR